MVTRFTLEPAVLSPAVLVSADCAGLPPREPAVPGVLCPEDLVFGTRKDASASSASARRCHRKSATASFEACAIKMTRADVV